MSREYQSLNKMFRTGLHELLFILLLVYTVRGPEREGESREGSEEATEVLFLRSDLSVLCLFSVWRLSVSCFGFLFAVLCQSIDLNCRLLESTVFRRWGLCSPEASKLAGDNMWESCSLLIFIIMFSVACEISPFTSTHILNQ